MEQLTPFVILAGTVRQVSIDTDNPGEVELRVIEGGPVYGWIDSRRDAAQALRMTDGTMTDQRGDPTVDFDLAATATGETTRAVEGGIGVVTLFSANRTVGYLLHRQRGRKK